MRKLYIVIVLLFLGVQSQAQNKIANLEGINYQAIALDHEGRQIPGEDIDNKPVYEKNIGVRFTIDAGPSGSETYYSDEHEVMTDKYGLFSLVIGLGTQNGSGTYDNLLDIPWINGDQWLKVEIAIHNDGDYRTVNYEKLMAVPFSFYTDDIADNSITTWKVVDEALLNVDIDTGAVETSEILNETIKAEDIDTGSVETSEILDETILAEDIATGAVETSEILNETIQAEDIDTGAVTTSEILDETILAEDIAAGAVETSEIHDLTILNEDIRDSTINLQSKITDILQVKNGGTGASNLPYGVLTGNGTSAVSSLGSMNPGDIVIGDSSGVISVKNMQGGTGISIAQNADTLFISNTITGGVSANGNTTVNFGNIAPGQTKTSPAFPIPGKGQLGDIILGSIDKNLQGCMLTAYFTTGNTAKVAIFNGTGSSVNLGQVTVKLLTVQ